MFSSEELRKLTTLKLRLSNRWLGNNWREERKRWLFYRWLYVTGRLQS
jgi:hypothetical protein